MFRKTIFKLKIMLTIYHNPRCSKSREAVAYLENLDKKFETVLYLENPLTESEIKDLLLKLNRTPMDIIRKGESAWKENFKGKELTDSSLIKAMAQYPKLIERPIIVKNNKAVIGRPVSNIEQLF